MKSRNRFFSRYGTTEHVVIKTSEAKITATRRVVLSGYLLMYCRVCCLITHFLYIMSIFFNQYCLRIFSLLLLYVL